jgi:nucleotide-binding universal stress UspA family protein
MQRILVATDGSSHGQKAVVAAAKIAAAESSKLFIVNVLDEQSIPDDIAQFGGIELADVIEARGPNLPPDIAGLYTDLLWPDAVRMLENQSLLLKQVVSDNVLSHARGLARNSGATDVETLSKTGDPAAQILEVARELGPDLIVVGRRGLGRLAELVLGSVSSKLLHRSPTDVLVVV